MKEVNNETANQPEAYLFVVEDKPAGIVSPVFEQSSTAAACRVFRLKTLKDLPEGFDPLDLTLYLVGKRSGTIVQSLVPMPLMNGNEVT